MLRIYDVSLALIRRLRGPVEAIGRHDRDQARQLRRSLASVTLNIAEGSGSHGGTLRARYSSALGSARESLANLELAEALGYADHIEPEVRSMFDHIIGVLVKIVYR